MKRLVILVIGLLMLRAGLAQAAFVNFYTDRNAWEAAVATYSLEAFDTLPLQSGINIQSFNGVADTSNGMFSYTPDQFVFGFGSYATFIRFTNPINAFGANWYKYDAGWNDNLTLLFGENISYIGQSFGQFIGFATTDHFDTIGLDYLFGSTAKPYSLDNLVYGDTTSSSVPEPSTFLLLAAGIGGLALIRRKTHKQ